LIEQARTANRSKQKQATHQVQPTQPVQ